MSTWFDKNFKILHNYAKLFNNGGFNNIQSYVRMQNSLFSGPTNNWNWSLEKKCIEMRVFFAKKKKKKSFFSFLFGLCTYIEKKLQKRSLFSCTIRLRFAAKEANLCIHKSKHQKKGENLPAARPKARYFVPKIILINCEKDLFLWLKKKMKVAWNLFEIPRIIYSKSAVKGFLIQNIYIFLYF